MAKSQVPESIEVLDGNDAEEYIKSMLSFQQIVRVDRPTGKGPEMATLSSRLSWGR